METIIENLKNIFGNHSRVARAIGITPRHYREIRAKRQYSKQVQVALRLLYKDRVMSICSNSNGY